MMKHLDIETGLPASTRQGSLWIRTCKSALLGLALACASTTFADPPPPHGIVAATIGVQQLGFANPPDNLVVTNQYALGDFRIRPTANKGDYDVQIGDVLSDDVEGGVLITSIAENGGRNNVDASGASDPTYPGINTATAHVDYIRTGANAGGYYIPVAMTYPNSAGTTVVEYNMNVAAGWFPYNQWIGAFIRNSGGTNGGANDLLTGSPGLALGTHFIDLGSGRSTVDLTSLGINSQTDGVLLVVGAKNEDNYALSTANTNGTWSVYSKDNGTDAASLEQDPIAFVYIPKTNSLVVSGRFLGDGTVVIAGGAFTVTLIEEGRWELKIPGKSPRNGVLLISPEGGSTQNRDNIVSAAPNAARDGWIIESRDLPNSVPPNETLPILETPGVEPVASFVFIPGATAGFAVTPTNNVFTTEAGGTGTFTVKLETEPTRDVTVALSSNNEAEGAVTPSSLTFTPANWNVPQTVTVTGKDDPATDGPVTYTILLAPATSADLDYNQKDPVNVTVVNLDNDGAATVNPTGGISATEAGGTATFIVRLDMLPTADVTIALSSSDTTEGTISPATLTFTPANWNQDQTVTITGVDDAVDDGDIEFTIVTAPMVSNDPAFNGKNPADVTVKTADDDTVGITVAPTTGLSVVESGSTATYTIVLNTQPTADVVITAASGDATEGAVSPGTLTFTASNWNAAQTVTLTGVDDLVVDGNASYTITNTAASSDPLYAAIKPSNVTATTLDNEAVITLFNEGVIYGTGMPPIAIASRATLSDPNSGSYAGATLDIALSANAAPEDTLAVKNIGTDPGQIGVSGTNVTFGGAVIATFSGGSGSAPLSFKLNSSADAAAVESLLRAITFVTTTNNPSTAWRTLTVTFTDADKGVSAASSTIRVGLLRRADFQEGADHGYGVYTGAADIELFEQEPDTAKPTGRGTSGLFIDWPDPNTPNTGQVLLRFGNILGNAPWQIPTNAIIVSAELFLDMNDSGDGSPLYRMRRAWDADNETWNSIGGGVATDDSEARAQYDSQIGVENGTGATTAGTVWVSVTPDVQAWVSGAETNHGWVMPGWQANLDGTGFSPSEAANIADRPRLRVTWLPAGSATLASFRQDADGYTGVVDTRIRQNAPDTDYTSVTTVFVDAVVSGTDPNPEQVLLRFDNIVGSEAGKIPAGARVEAAVLDVASVNGDAMGDGGSIYSLLQPWPEMITWNGWVDGVQTDGREAAAAPSAIAGNATLNPDVQGGFLSFDLTPDVQAWVSGARTNAGWVIVPWPGGGNGWGFTTSENGTERNRPRLRVYYTATAPVTITLQQPVFAAGKLQLRFTAGPNATYSIHRAGSVTGPWTKIGTATTTAAGTGDFTDDTPPAGMAFYRVSSP